MDWQTLMALLARQQQPDQANPYYNAQQVGGQGILGAGLRNQAGQIEQQTGGMPPPSPQPMPAPQGGLLGTAPVQQMSPPPQANAGEASKQALIAAILASGDKTRIAQLRHAGLIP
jgi:hypothetical protein